MTPGRRWIEAKNAGIELEIYESLESDEDF